MKSAYGLSIPEQLQDTCTPSKCALLIYDMQVGIVPQIAEGAAIVAQCRQLLGAARDKGFRVFFLRHFFLPNHMAGVGQLRRSMIWQRRPQLAYIKRQGYKKAVLWRSLLYESALLLGTGCSIGAAFGLYGQLVQSHALATVTGFPIVISIGPLVAVRSFALVSAVAVGILALPGYLAVGVRPTMVSST